MSFQQHLKTPEKHTVQPSAKQAQGPNQIHTRTVESSRLSTNASLVTSRSRTMILVMGLAVAISISAKLI